MPGIIHQKMPRDPQPAISQPPALIFTPAALAVGRLAAVVKISGQPAAITLRDLQRGFAQWNNGGATNPEVRNGFMLLIGAVAVMAGLLALLTYLKRRRTAESMPRLGRELCRALGLDTRTKLALHWLAHSSQTPVAVLLISPRCLARELARWRDQDKFNAWRRKSAARLASLEQRLGQRL